MGFGDWYTHDLVSKTDTTQNGMWGKIIPDTR